MIFYMNILIIAIAPFLIEITNKYFNISPFNIMRTLHIWCETEN
jgi:hypothetical protein